VKIAIGVPDNLDTLTPNGFPTVFRQVYNALEGHERIVYAPSGGDVRLEGGCEARGDGGDGLMDRYRSTIAVSKDFAGKVGDARPDAILAFNSMGLFLKQRHIYHTSSVPYRKVRELVDGEYPQTPHFQKLLDYYAFVGEREGENFEKAEMIITHSVKIRQHIIEEHGVEPGKVTYLRRPIPDLRDDAGTKRAESGGRRMRVVLMPAELRVMKGTGYAIEAMKILKKSMPEAVLVICGRMNNYEQDYMRSLLDGAKGKANIIVAGFLPKERLYGYMRMADCAFMPFCFDECPIALCECLGHALPVVTNEYAGFGRGEIDSFGYCARYKDAGDYAEGLTCMLTDEGFRRRKADGAAEAIKRYGADDYRRAVNDVFGEFAGD
jgi:glycosyltransferase involved in cell wall biosynthesis